MSSDENDIEWDEIKDNLNIREVDEKYFIDLGNPFNGEIRYLNRDVDHIPHSPVRLRVKKIHFLFYAILILITVFFCCKSGYTDTVAKISEDFETAYLLEIEYSPNLEQVQYTLTLYSETSDFDGAIKVDIDDLCVGEMTSDRLRIVHDIFPEDGKTISVVFYLDSFLFGRRIINSTEIFIPFFSLNTAGTEIKMTNSHPHRLLVYLPDNTYTILQRGEYSSIPKKADEDIILLLVDLATRNELKIILRGAHHAT